MSILGENMNSVEMASDLINRARNLKEFIIERDISEHGIFFDGSVPFDIKATQDKAWFKVYAITKEDAEAQVDNWLGWRI